MKTLTIESNEMDLKNYDSSTKFAITMETIQVVSEEIKENKAVLLREAADFGDGTYQLEVLKSDGTLQNYEFIQETLEVILSSTFKNEKGELSNEISKASMMDFDFKNFVSNFEKQHSDKTGLVFPLPMFNEIDVFCDLLEGMPRMMDEGLIDISKTKGKYKEGMTVFSDGVDEDKIFEFTKHLTEGNLKPRYFARESQGMLLINEGRSVVKYLFIVDPMSLVLEFHVENGVVFGISEALK